MTVTVVRKTHLRDSVILFTLFCHNLFGFFLIWASCLTSLALQFCSKVPASYKVWNSLHGMVRTCNFAVCQQVKGQEHLRSSCLRIESMCRWYTTSSGSSSPALHTWRLVCLRGPLQPSERCLFLAFAHNIGATSINVSRRLSRRKTFKKFTCCATSV